MIHKLIKIIPHSAKKKLQSSLIQTNQLTTNWRVLPDFLIIGTMKAGTSSLYEYLTQHPYIIRAIRKEIDFFNHHFDKGSNWYCSHFPIQLNKAILQKFYQHHCITGEASPNYMVDPLVPKRVKQIIPQVKVIVLLRNPINRAYSHYNMAVQQGFETLSFEQALDIESERLAAMQNETLDDAFLEFRYRYLYTTLSLYAKQLSHWLNIFPQEQFLFIKSEDFHTDPANTLTQVFQFLDVPDWKLHHYKIYHKGQYPEMSMDTRTRLATYFEPYNQQLEEQLNIQFKWQ